MIATALVVALTTAGILSAVPPFEGQGRDEVRFVEACRSGSGTCVYGRVRFGSDGEVHALVTHALELSDERIARLLDHGAFWPGHWPCSGTRILHSSVILLDGAGHEVFRVERLPVQQIGGGFCEFDSSAALPGDAGRANARHAVLRFAQASQGVPGRRYYEINVREFATSRYVVESDPHQRLVMDSPVIGDGAVRGVVDNAAVVDIGADEAVRATIRISEYADWDAFARAYGEAEQRALGPVHRAETGRPANPRQGARRDDDAGARLAQAMADVNAALSYQAGGPDAGMFPSRSVADVMASGFGDCKSLSLALIAALREQGLQAASIITSTRDRMPESVLVPDLRWANHVLVHVEDLDAYVDMTLPVGAQLIDRKAGSYGTLGIHTRTGAFVVIR